MKSKPRFRADDWIKFAWDMLRVNMKMKGVSGKGK